MPTPSSPKKAQSIEDLLKKPAAANPLLGQAGYVAGTPKKTGKTTSLKGKTPFEMNEAEKLSVKMSEIKTDELEKQAQEKAAEAGLPYIGLKGFPVDPEVLGLLSREEATQTKTIAFLKQGSEMRIATSRPGKAVEALAKRLAEQQGANVQTYYISDQSFEYGLKLYDSLPETREIIYGVRIDEEALQRYEKEISNFHDLQEKITRVSTTDVITLMIGAALRSSASDIHVEAEEEAVKLRFRLDGLLQDAAKLPRETWKQIISRLKLLAGVKINVEGVPQDGRLTIYLSDEKIDIRVSFLPTAFGESVVMRILRPKSIALEFEKLGVRGKAWEQLQREIGRPNGLILTTGPTGSGKTTTLYAILKKLNQPSVKIITLEDPIEYKLVGINQSQVNHSKDYDFAKGLRSILRQDPDIVMVGEIRDLETAEIAIQASLTGHLVLSTVHTNSAAGAIPRFLSMGVKPFLLAPSVNAIIGQRLVRKLCETCKVKKNLMPDEVLQIKNELGKIPKDSGYSIDLAALSFYGPAPQGTPCDTCQGFGYKGRIGLYEIMIMTQEIESLILSGNVSEYQMAEIAVKQGMITMVQDGLLKALDGITSIEEVLRVAEIETITGNAS